MVRLQEKDEWNSEFLAGRIDGCLLRVLEPNGTQPFHTRLAELVKRQDLPRAIATMIRSLLSGYGHLGSAMGRYEFGITYMPDIKRLLPKDTKIPDMGRRTCEVLFIGAMLVVLERGTTEWNGFMNAWNRRLPRHLHLA